MPNIELETFDYTGRNMKKKSPSLAKEEEVKAPVDQGSSKKVNEGEVEGLSLEVFKDEEHRAVLIDSGENLQSNP